MSVVSVNEVAAGRSGEADEKYVRNYTRVFRVITNSNSHAAYTVLSATGIPAQWSAHPEDAQALALNARAEQTDDTGKVWLVTVDYSNQYGESGDSEENPLLRPVKWSMDFARYSQVIQNDIEGAPITNTVGEPFRDPPLEGDFFRPVYKAQRNEAVLNTGLIADMVNSVNSDPWKGFPPNYVRLNMITSGDLQTENGISFYRVTYEFEINKDTWTRKVLNRGHFAKVGNFFAPLDGQEPHLLKEDGTVIPKEDTETPRHYCQFNVYQKRPFVILGL